MEGSCEYFTAVSNQYKCICAEQELIHDCRIVSRNLSSALILEDDVDWDIRLRSQLRAFALATQALTQPLQSFLDSYADPTYPPYKAPTGPSEPVYHFMDSLPTTLQPSTSPYGDNWDVLHIGHCGTRSPAIDVPESWQDFAHKVPRGHVIQLDDPTVPEPH